MKIEVCLAHCSWSLLTGLSGLGLHPPPRGDSTLDVIDLARAETVVTAGANAHLLAAVADLPHLAAGTTLLARTIAVTVAASTTTAAALAALTTATER